MKWQRYTTKTNEADARRVMTRKAAADGRRYKLTDEKGNLVDLIGQGLQSMLFHQLIYKRFQTRNRYSNGFQKISKNIFDRKSLSVSISVNVKNRCGQSQILSAASL